MMTDAERKQRYEVITESWKLMNNTMKNLPKTDSDFQRFVSYVYALYEKFGKTEFAKDILVAVQCEIDRIVKNQEEK